MSDSVLSSEDSAEYKMKKTLLLRGACISMIKEWHIWTIA